MIVEIEAALRDGHFDWDFGHAINQVREMCARAKLFNSHAMNLMWGSIYNIGTKDPTRTVKIMTNEAGMEIFNQAIQKEFGSSK